MNALKSIPLDPCGIKVSTPLLFAMLAIWPMLLMKLLAFFAKLLISFMFPINCCKFPVYKNCAIPPIGI